MENSTNILELIPQREPMVMVDEHISTEDNLTKTRFTVKPETIFLENNVLSEAGLIENMAQSAAVHSGFHFKQSGKMKAPIGFIATIQELEIVFLPESGSILQTEIQFIDEVMGVKIIEGKTFVNNELAASCKMKIFLKD